MTEADIFDFLAELGRTTAIFAIFLIMPTLFGLYLATVLS